MSFRYEGLDNWSSELSDESGENLLSERAILVSDDLVGTEDRVKDIW